jgi:hypothetical protein
LTQETDGKTSIGLGVFGLFHRVGNTMPPWDGFLQPLSPLIQSGFTINRWAGAGPDKRIILIFGDTHLPVGSIF